jgi:tetratricopeptide (TPR) repeat protein
MGQQTAFLEARNAYQSGEYAQALEKLQPLLSDKVEDADVLLLSGDIHTALAVKDSFQQNHLRQAVLHYHEVRIMSPEESQQQYDAAIALEKLWQQLISMANDYQAQQKYPEALAMLDHAKTVLPEKNKTYLLAGKLAFGIKDYGTTAENFNYLLDSLHYEGEQLQEVLNSLLASSFLSKNVEDSDVMQTAREAEKDSINAIEVEIATLIEEGNLTGAEAVISSSSVANHQAAKYFFDIAQRFRATQDLDKANQYLQKTLEVQEDHADALFLLAMNFQRMAQEKLNAQEQDQARGYLEQGIQHLDQLKKTQADYPLLDYSRATLAQTLEGLS